MAQLDRFFEVLVQRGARELRLLGGRAPAFVFDDGERPASTARPTHEQLLALLAEVLDPTLLAEYHAQGRARGIVRRDGLPSLTVEIDTIGDGAASTLGARFTLAPAPAAPDVSAPAQATTHAAAQATSLGAIESPSSLPVPTAPVQSTAPRPTTSEPPIEALLRELVLRKGSDLHLSSDEQPIVRIDGEIERLADWPALDARKMWELLAPIVPERNRAEFEATKDTDFAHEIAGLARFRANLFTDRKGAGAVFRIIPSKILTAQDLGLSPAILELCKLTKGLVLVTGPTGSGKSTTLTALIDHVNRIRRDHIITIEDPIEFVHDNRTCLVNQREVGVHTESFKRALKAALREDPDIVLVGELRDLETISIAIETAETGHLVFGTLHTTTAVSTVDRIIDQFPADRQAQIRTMLSESLKGVIAQTLCRKVSGGRIAALEVLIGIPSVANLIREGKTFQIPSIMQTGRKFGMVTLNDALLELVKKGVITGEEAYIKAVDKTGISTGLKQVGAEVST